MSVNRVRGNWRMRTTLALGGGLVASALLFAAMTAQAADDNVRPQDRNAAARDARPPRPPRGPETGPRDDFGPPERPGQGDDRWPGPPPGRGPNGQQPGPGGPQAAPPGGPQGGMPGGPGFQPPGGPPGPFPGGPFAEKNDPDMNKLIQAEMDIDRRTRELVREYRQASEDQRAKLKEDLKKLVNQQFDTRQQRRKLEISRLEEELKRLGDSMNRREKNRQSIVDKRASDLLGEDADSGF